MSINTHITMSSRVRLARNFSGSPFPGRLSRDDSSALIESVKAAFFSSMNVTDGAEYLFVDIQRLDPVERMMLIEKHLISPDLAASELPCAAIVSKDEQVSVMLNEEDHLRVQCVMPSDDIDSAYERSSDIERVFDRQLRMAYDDEFGYLTCCPTNLGTGMRASFMLHLPALVMTGHIKDVIESCGKIGVAVRGLYGENSEASGNMFQFSNQSTLGNSEPDIIESIKDIKNQITGHESRLRDAVQGQSSVKFEDRVFRALGTLGSARIMSGDEFMRLWSDVRLGADTGVIGDISIGTIDKMLMLVQPAYIQKMYGQLLNSEERDIKRAKLVRDMLTVK